MPNTVQQPSTLPFLKEKPAYGSVLSGPVSIARSCYNYMFAVWPLSLICQRAVLSRGLLFSDINKLYAITCAWSKRKQLAGFPCTSKLSWRTGKSPISSSEVRSETLMHCVHTTVKTVTGVIVQVERERAHLQGGFPSKAWASVAGHCGSAPWALWGDPSGRTHQRRCSSCPDHTIMLLLASAQASSLCMRLCVVASIAQAALLCCPTKQLMLRLALVLPDSTLLCVSSCSWVPTLGYQGFFWSKSTSHCVGPWECECVVCRGACSRTWQSLFFDQACSDRSNHSHAVYPSCLLCLGGQQHWLQGFWHCLSEPLSGLQDSKIPVESFDNLRTICLAVQVPL